MSASDFAQGYLATRREVGETCPACRCADSGEACRLPPQAVEYAPFECAGPGPWLLVDRLDGEEISQFGALIYADPRTAAVVELARRFAKTSLPILITGESGTGKELLAQGIHTVGARSSKPLVLTPAAIAALESYDFPGNVRELRNIAERAVALVDGDEIGIEELEFGPVFHASVSTDADLNEERRDPREKDVDMTEVLRMRKAGKTAVQIAAAMGVSRPTIYRRLVKWWARNGREIS